MVTFSVPRTWTIWRHITVLKRCCSIRAGARMTSAAVKDDASTQSSGLRVITTRTRKEVLYENIYEGTPYGHYNGGTVSSLEKITLAD